MLLPLLGACAVVGPFQGPEWEPVQGLLSEDRSCRDPRCCGNLLVLCLFLIWQVQHYWHQVTRTHPSTRKVIKVTQQKWTVPSVRHDTRFRMTPEFFFSPENFNDLDAYVQQWVQKKRQEYRRGLQVSRTQHLLSWQHPFQGPPQDFHTPIEPFFCTTSLSSTCMLLQDSSREARQVPWCLSDERTHLICKSLSPALDRYQRMEQLLVHSQEELVSLERVVSLRSHLTSRILATSLSNLPSSQRLQFCSRDFLPDPSIQQVRMSTWKSWRCPQKARVPGRENQMLGREALGWVNQTESSGEDAWEIQVTGRQLPVNFEMEDGAETKFLAWSSRKLVISKTDGNILTSGSKNQHEMGIEKRAEIQELGNRNEREAEGENPPGIQAHIAEHQEQLRCKTDAETQIPEWGNQEKSRDEDAVVTQALEKNKKEARGEDEGETKAQELEKQDQSGSEDGEESQLSGWGKQDEMQDDTSIKIQAQERRDKAQAGGENDVQTQVLGRENLGEVTQEKGVETQVLGWEKQECARRENVIGTQTPGWGKKDQSGSEKSEKIQASKEEIWKQLRHELLVGWRNQGPRRGEDAGETQISRRKNFREIREEDWVVIRAPWWGNKRLVASKIDKNFEIQCWGHLDQSGSEIYRECKIPCWGNQIGGEFRAKTQATEKRDQRKDGEEDGTNTLAPEAEDQGQLRHETLVDTHPPERRNEEQFGDDNRIDIQALGKRNLTGVKGEVGKETQELGEENQGQSSSKINSKIHTSECKNQEYIRGKDGANTQASEPEKRRELISKVDGETHSAEWKTEEQVGDENGTGIQAPITTSQREAVVENDTETWEHAEEDQSQVKGVIDRKIHLSEWKNQEQTGGKNGRRIQAGSEDAVEIQRPERESQQQLDGGTGESHSPRRSNWEQRGKEEENQTLGKRRQREARSEGSGKTPGPSGGSGRLIESKANEKSCSSEWTNQEQAGGENGADTEIHGKRNLRETTGDEGTEAQAPGGDYQGQVRSEVDGEIQIQELGNQDKDRDEDAAEIQDAGSRTECRAEEAGGPHIPKGGNEKQVRGKDAAKDNLPVDSSGGEGPGYEAMEQQQAVASAPCPELKLLPSCSQLSLHASVEGEHMVSQSMASAKKHRVRVRLASQQAPPEALKSRRKDKRVDPGRTSGWMRQLQNLHSGELLAAPLGLPSARPSVSCRQASQAAAALVGAPTVLTVSPKWPVLKKSQQLLLESLMRRKIAHLRWGLPKRILESHLLFNKLGPCPLPRAGMRLPGLYTAHELQRQQGTHCEVQGCRPGLKSTERSQRVQPPERKSSKLPTRARALEKCGSHGCESMGISIHSEKPGRVRPPGGTREPWDIPEKAPRAKAAATYGNSRPAAQSRSWCGQEPSSENNRDRKVVRPGVSQTAEMAPCKVRTSYSRAGHDAWRKESIPQEAPEPPRLKCQQPTHGRRESLEAAEGRGAGQQPSFHFTNTSNFKYYFHSAAARLSTTLLNKISWSPHQTKPQHSAPNLSLRDPDPTLLSKVSDQHTRKDSPGVCISLKTDLQPPSHSCAEAVLPQTKCFHGQGEPENLHGSLKNPSAPQKFGLMKHLRCFLLQHGFRK
ncbi:uncharacterized protein LOC131838018 [Mustela lutreola]|uniref:uncharacterized protein LOC131838018 n=1 Tax=Mustela lutreola TaxID=9666 RepID=UPI002797048A|nr:uncharacterized protein LOC131838018 [Mustela lutreola]